MLTETGSPALLPVYATFPLRAASGHGSWLVDEEGNEWLDAYGGHAVATAGTRIPTWLPRSPGSRHAAFLFDHGATSAREQLAEGS